MYNFKLYTWQDVWWFLHKMPPQPANHILDPTNWFAGIVSPPDQQVQLNEPCIDCLARRMKQLRWKRHRALATQSWPLSVILNLNYNGVMTSEGWLGQQKCIFVFQLQVAPWERRSTHNDAVAWNRQKRLPFPPQFDFITNEARQSTRLRRFLITHLSCWVTHTPAPHEKIARNVYFTFRRVRWCTVFWICWLSNPSNADRGHHEKFVTLLKGNFWGTFSWSGEDECRTLTAPYVCLSLTDDTRHPLEFCHF